MLLYTQKPSCRNCAFNPIVQFATDYPKKTCKKTCKHTVYDNVFGKPTTTI